MTMTLEQIKTKYPNALAWSFGDSPALANELATLVLTGKKNRHLQFPARLV